MSPLVPTTLDVVLIVVSFGALILALAAFISLLRAATPSGWALLAWTLVVLFVPIVGPATWLVGRRRERAIALEHVRSSSVGFGADAVCRRGRDQQGLPGGR
ncbi:PLDc N-terminal domain-containing protein [Curtobacterium flaccumfaciens]|nr:PLDc N-terminal domain-containing protein [Curtobacterium flaccumfaciens]